MTDDPTFPKTLTPEMWKAAQEVIMREGFLTQHRDTVISLLYEAFRNGAPRQHSIAVAPTIVNHFSGNGISPTAHVTATSVTIPDSYVGKKYGDQEGLFLGYFDLGEKIGTQPIFVVKLTDSATFDKTLAATGELETGYKADSLIYDAREGLRNGKMVIASHDMVRAAYENKNKGEFAAMFKDARSVLTSTPHRGHSGVVRCVDFSDGTDEAGPKNIFCGHSLLVLTRLTP